MFETVKLIYKGKKIGEVWVGSEEVNFSYEYYDDIGKRPIIQTVSRQVEWEMKVAGFEVVCKQQDRGNYIDKKAHPLCSYIYERYFVKKENFRVFMLQALMGNYGEIVKINTIRYGDPRWYPYTRITPELKEHFAGTEKLKVMGRVLGS